MAALTLRVLTRSGDTTKNAPLTNSEIDTNFINIDEELGLKAPVASPTFTGTATIPTGVINSGTASTTTTTGALVVTGGVGVSGQVNAGSFAGTGTSLTALNASQLTSGTIPGDRGVTAGSATPSFVEYNGTTKTDGQFDGGAVAPTNTTRLNYDGYLYATRFYGDGSQLTGTAASFTAGSVTNGVYTTGNQSIAGVKTWTGQQVWSGTDIHVFSNVNASYTGSFMLGNRWIRKLTTGHSIEFVNQANTIVTHTFGDTGDFTATGAIAATSTVTGTNLVYNNGSYANPTWITSLDFSKISGSGVLAKNIQVISTNTTAVSGRTYVLTASLTLTLPASPTAGMTVDIINRSGTTTCVVGRNAVNIMGLAEDLTIDSLNMTFTLTYADATRGWVFN